MQYIRIVAISFALAQVHSFRLHVESGVGVRKQRNSVATSTQISMSIPTPIDVLTSGLASICRTPFGVTVRENDGASKTIDPIRIKVLYDIENSPDCRRVRELITELDLNVDVVVPATKNARCFIDPNDQYAISAANCIIPRMTIIENGNKEIIVEGVDDIIAMLETKYSPSTSNDAVDTDTKDQIVATLKNVGNYVATVLRIGRGMAVSPAGAFRLESSTDENTVVLNRPKEPMILYSYEGNQFCRLVREVLTELDVPYALRSTGKGSVRRDELSEMTENGSTRCQYFIDPNTNTKMSESNDIIRYLYQTYALYTPPSELVQWASDYILPLAKPLFAILAPLQAGASLGGSNADLDMEYQQRIESTWTKDVQPTINSAPVVVYTYGLSPFSTEIKAMLENMNIEYTEVSLGLEWIPGLIKEGGSEIRAAFLEKTGQSSLPHVFIGGQSIGGLFSGTPGLLKLAEQGKLLSMIEESKKRSQKPALN